MLFGELSKDALDISVFFVNLVDRNDHRYASSACVTDCFNGLRHHTVIGSNHQHNNVGDLSTTSTHLRERGVTRCVNEGDFLAILHHLVCTDVLGDSTSFTRNNIGVTNLVEQRRLTVVNVTHHGDHWWTQLLRCLVVVIAVVEEGLQFHFFLLTGLNQKNLGTNFKCEQFHLFVRQGHRCRDHFTVLQQEANDVGCSAVKARCKFL